MTTSESGTTDAVESVRSVVNRLDRAANPMLVCSCGVELPVEARWLEIARRLNFYPVSRHMKRLFYQALFHKMGPNWTRDRAFSDIRLLSVHRRHIRLGKRQVHGIYGLHHGIMGSDGKFKGDIGSVLDSGRSISEVDWPIIHKMAIMACKGLPEQADIREEFRWLNSKMFEWPDFKKAPSQTVIKWWMGFNNPKGMDPAYRELVRVSMSKRLSPGDPEGKKKVAAAFEEDESVEDGAAEREEYQRRLGRRLFGSEGE